jgi:hypothetical protein
VHIFSAVIFVFRLSSLPAARQAELAARTLVETAEFAANCAEEVTNRASATAAAATLKIEEAQGRTTGSVEWRAARGELGADASAVERAAAEEKLAASSSSTAAPAAAASSSSAQLCVTDPLVPVAIRDSSSAPPVAASPAAASTPSTPVSGEDAAAAKARTATLFRAYLSQLSSGCGSAECDTPACKSNPAFTTPRASEIAKVAIAMVKGGPAQLCKRKQIAPPAASAAAASASVPADK